MLSFLVQLRLYKLALKHWYWSILIFIVTIAGFWGVCVEPQQLSPRRVARKSWTGSDLKIVFFSDLHAGAPHIDCAYIKDLVDRINAESPDLVLIGGDIVTAGVLGGTRMAATDVANLLGKLSAKLGVFAVLGNHDWWYGGAEVASALKIHGIEILENQGKLIERADKSKLWLIGIGDDFTDHSNPRKAFALTNRDWPKIIFMHDPGSILQIRESFYAAFAGHMHGGQVFIPGIGALVTLSRAPRQWVADDWIDSTQGTILVSRGIGTSILPIRLNAPPEYVIASLRQAPVKSEIMSQHSLLNSGGAGIR